ncbi:hypothetical protein NZL82_07045 [Sphingomonas sanguinis]|jgi:hypothetical protein|nr:hypothetical protein [Sphingomonas sp. LC-1]MCT8001634.1 hypothetical protein [Sphingomonas sp. LC-1]
MTAKPTTKTPPAQTSDTAPSETPARVRPKLSLHYGASSKGEGK